MTITIKNNTTYSIVNRLTLDLIESAMSLFWEVFSKKLSKILGAEERACSFLQHFIVVKQVICALDFDRKLLGLATIKTDKYGFFNLKLRDFCTEYGVLSGCLRALLMSCLEENPGCNEMMVESICVDKSARGKGIGQALLTHIINQASEQKKKYIVLDVIAENQDAYRLSRRIGFDDISRKNFIFLDSIFSFRQVIRMQLNIDNFVSISNQ